MLELKLFSFGVFKVLELDGLFVYVLCVLMFFFVLLNRIFELKVFVFGGFKILEFKVIIKFLLSLLLVVFKVSGILKLGESRIFGYVGEKLIWKILSIEKEVVVIGLLVVFLFVEIKIKIFLFFK